MMYNYRLTVVLWELAWALQLRKIPTKGPPFWNGREFYSSSSSSDCFHLTSRLIAPVRSPGATQNVAVMVCTVSSLKVFNKMPLRGKKFKSLKTRRSAFSPNVRYVGSKFHENRSSRVAVIVVRHETNEIPNTQFKTKTSLLSVNIN